jgi:hypothetical protein
MLAKKTDTHVRAWPASATAELQEMEETVGFTWDNLPPTLPFNKRPLRPVFYDLDTTGIIHNKHVDLREW